MNFNSIFFFFFSLSTEMEESGLSVFISREHSQPRSQKNPKRWSYQAHDTNTHTHTHTLYRCLFLSPHTSTHTETHTHTHTTPSLSVTQNTLFQTHKYTHTCISRSMLKSIFPQ